jgi:hypothetical protein
MARLTYTMAPLANSKEHSQVNSRKPGQTASRLLGPGRLRQRPDSRVSRGIFLFLGERQHMPTSERSSRWFDRFVRPILIVVSARKMEAAPCLCKLTFIEDNKFLFMDRPSSVRTKHCITFRRPSVNKPSLSLVFVRGRRVVSPLSLGTMKCLQMAVVLTHVAACRQARAFHPFRPALSAGEGNHEVRLTSSRISD